MPQHYSRQRLDTSQKLNQVCHQNKSQLCPRTTCDNLSKRQAQLLLISLQMLHFLYFLLYYFNLSFSQLYSQKSLPIVNKLPCIIKGWYCSAEWFLHIPNLNNIQLNLINSASSIAHIRRRYLFLNTSQSMDLGEDDFLEALWPLLSYHKVNILISMKCVTQFEPPLKIQVVSIYSTSNRYPSSQSLIIWEIGCQLPSLSFLPFLW